jgi:hypothetical protein
MENTDITNEAFAEFLGATYIHDEKLFYFPSIVFKTGKNWFYSHELLFHNDCNWINDVIRKIKIKSLAGSMGSEINRKRIEFFKTITIFSEKEEVYNACAEFVKWYKLNNN